MRLGRIGFDHVVGYLQGWIAQPEIAAGTDGHDGTPERAVRRGAFVIGEAAAGHRCPHAARARAEAHRRKFEHPAQSSGGKSGKVAKGPAAAGLLRGRLPIVHRRELAAAGRDCARQRNCRRHRGVGNREAAGAQRQRVNGRAKISERLAFSGRPMAIFCHGKQRRTLTRKEKAEESSSKARSSVALRTAFAVTGAESNADA